MNKRTIIIIAIIFFVFGFFLRPPLDGGKITSLYGFRLQFSRAFHRGTDIGHTVGVNINSISWGTVRSTGYESRGGNFVMITHYRYIETRYYHLHTINVSAGDKVNPNSKIGTLGNTGQSTGAHLHYELRVFGIPLPPHLLCTPGRVLKVIGFYKVTDYIMNI